MVKSKKLFKYYSLVIISLFILTRLSFLDRDLPPWELTLYSSFDEMLYNIPAFNLYEFGEMSHQVVPFLPDDSITHNNWLQNYITYISFKLFGNNYFGLRMPSVIASSIIICLLLYFLYNILNINKWGKNV